MNVVSLYERLTLVIGHETGASDSLIHVHAGMALLLLARILSGRSLATPLPFLTVCVFAMANEVLDRINYGAWRWEDTILDLANTLFWPFILLIGLRVRRLREGREPGSGRPLVQGQGAS